MTPELQWEDIYRWARDFLGMDEDEAVAYTARRMQLRELERQDRERRWHTTDAPED